MTSFSRTTELSNDIEIIWELKTVNHRYLDINLRLPDALRHLEMKASGIIQQALGRGKCEATCRYNVSSQQQSELCLDNDKVAAVISACNEIELQMGIGKAINAIDILKYPGVVMQKNNETLDCDELVLSVLTNCLNELQQSRQSEGQRLQAFILQRAKAIEDIVADVKKRRPAVIAAIQDKLKQRLQELTESPDQDRFEQELVVIAHKMDVDEELDRLESHLLELKEVFERDEPIGRRLDFLMQEFNREANTLGSKSADFETTQAAVNLKVLIEQMREQVQNIE